MSPTTRQYSGTSAAAGVTVADTIEKSYPVCDTSAAHACFGASRGLSEREVSFQSRNWFCARTTTAHGPRADTKATKTTKITKCFVVVVVFVAIVPRREAVAVYFVPDLTGVSSAFRS